MKVAVVTDFHAPPQIQDLPTPTPGNPRGQLTADREGGDVRACSRE